MDGSASVESLALSQAVAEWLVDALVAVLVAGWVVYRIASASGPADAAPDALGYRLALSMAAALLVGVAGRWRCCRGGDPKNTSAAPRPAVARFSP